MGIVPRIRASVLAAKQVLAAGREKVRRQHDDGSPGIQVTARLTDLLDTVILDLTQTALDDLAADGPSANLNRDITLVAHGGYGRRDTAPFSDVDLLLLHKPSAETRVQPLAQRLVTDISDVGLQLGFSVRTPAQACSLARRDPVILTSQAETRYLTGSVRLLSQFTGRFRRQTQRRWRTLVNAIDNSRHEERDAYGETVYLLEPNIKRSKGTLRDIHFLRWIAFARYGQADPEHLRRMGVLSVEDEVTLRKAYEFLLRLRNELHFAAGKPGDLLHRSEQMRIAERWGYRGQSGLLPVEQFMRDYFQHTSGVRNLAGYLLATARQPSAVMRAATPLVSHLVERDYRVGPVHISATRRGAAKLRGNLEQVLRLMDLANLYDRRIEHRTWDAIRNDMTAQKDVEVSDKAARRFLSLLSQPPRLAALLRRLHELRVLEKLVAGMDHARCLLQFNTYHKYTVDEHCILAVQRATGFLNEGGFLEETYRSIKRRSILHLALLIHDLGKGYADDHSDVGLNLATQTAQSLKLNEEDTETLQFLVHRHLMMSHLAFRRDTSDESVIIEFAAHVGSPEILRMLFILTCADFAAVGPDVLNRWKIEVLTELYHRTLRHLSSDPGPSADSQLEHVHRLALETAPSEDVDWLMNQIRNLPTTYLADSDPMRLIQDLGRLCRLEPDRSVAWGRYVADRRVVEYTVGAYEQLTPGIFHRLTGALSSHGLQILAAEIHTLQDDLVLDRFYVHDNDYSGPPPEQRYDAVCRSLVDVMENPSDTVPSFRQTWQAGSGAPTRELELLSTRVVFDNSTSQKYTILDIFAHDRIGLLYTITRTLYELGVSVCVAKIGTYLDQVVDVFYVTNDQGHKIEDEQRLREIRRQVMQAIEEGALQRRCP